MTRKIIIFLFITAIYNLGFSQNSIDIFNTEIEELSKTKKSLNESIRIDLTGLTLYDFISTLAEEHELNVSVDPELTDIVRTNFFDVSIKDVFRFLIDNYDLQVTVNNNIILFNKKPEIVVEKKPIPIKKIDVSYKTVNDFLSVKLKNDSLPRVAEAITDASGKNVVLAPDIKTEKVSAYVLNRPFDQVIDMIAKSNGLAVNKDENNNYFLSKDNTPKENSTTSNSDRRGSTRRTSQKSSSNGDGSFEIEIANNGFLNVKAFEGDGSEIIIEAAEKLNLSFSMYDTPKDIKTTLIAQNITFDQLLNHIFTGENYTYKIVDDVYLIGEHSTKGLRTTELIQLENRTIETVLNTLPSTLTKDLEVKEFLDLNGFVVSGSKSNIQEFKEYIREIDRVVPVIQIEVIIVQYQKSYDIQTGIQAGLDDQSRTTSGVLFPTADVTLNAKSVNNLIDAFNGLGVINLGKVTEQFYLNLSFLENNSLIKLSSTPKLVTLNGHEANSTIGETSYYFEQNNQLITRGVTNDILQTGTWKSTEANLSINIKPFVSKDENVTLDIVVERSSFLARVGENAPPGKATQKFETLISVKNNEMILLGGLEELENENSGTGVPLISRIPPFSWFTSGRRKRKEKSKLHIFIKPTVTY
ncbi:MAG: type II secretion system protein GspD [Winogradskyella sp.]